MAISYTIEGIDGLLAKLDTLGAASGSALNKALLRGGEIVRAQAAADCPVDTGRLRSSIVVEAGDGYVTIGPTAHYGIYVEFGTGAKGDPSVSHTTKKGWVYYNKKTGGFVYTTGQAPQPFLVPALFSQKDAVIETIKDGLLEAIG